MPSRRAVLTTTGSVAAVSVLAGCLGSAQEDDGGSSGDPRTVTVTEGGEVEAEPDIAVFQASVEATGDDANAVREELAERADALYDALVEFGIDEDAITTGRFNIRDRVDERQLEEDGVEPGSE